MKASARPPQPPPDTARLKNPGLFFPKRSPDMTDPAPRLFATDAAIRRVGEGLILRNLPRCEWTHEAHLAACTFIVRDRPDIVPEREMGDIISRCNESVGGVNDDTQGYHETITQCFILAVRQHLRERPEADTLLDAVNTLLLSDRGKRDWPLRLYSRERLFSVAARRQFVTPDIHANGSELPENDSQ